MVIVSDTAGIHDTGNKVELEGIYRARKLAEQADMNIWLHAIDDTTDNPEPRGNNTLVVLTKSDMKQKDAGNRTRVQFDYVISALFNEGIGELVEAISESAKLSIAASGDILFSRQRQRSDLLQALDALTAARENETELLEVRAENLRLAASYLGRIVGKVDVEEVLGEIFSQFCVGK